MENVVKKIKYFEEREKMQDAVVVNVKGNECYN